VTALLRRLEDLLWPSAPPERLAVLRILVGIWCLGYLVVRLPVFLALSDVGRQGFHPVGVLSPLERPVAPALVNGAVLVTLLLAAAFVAGVGFRLVGPMFATSWLVLMTYRSSWGQVLWFETLVTLHVLIVGLAPSADALSWRRPAGVTGESRAFGGPVRLAAVVTVTTYVLSGVAKLRDGGLAWATAETLQHHIAFSAARLDVLGGTPAPLAAWLVSHPLLLGPAAVGTVVLELGAPLALLGGWLRNAWVAATWSLHVGIALGMLVVWGYPLWGVAFAPLFNLERLPARFRGPLLRTR
jgi:hypothetical protein